MQNQRNLLLAVVLCGLLLIGWDMAIRYFYPQPETITEEVTEGETAAPAVAGGTAEIAEGDAAAAPQTLEASLASTERVAIDAPEITGSINPVGAKIDDLSLKTHRQTVKDDSGPVRLFAPQGTDGQYFAQFGWVGEGIALPTLDTVWQVEGGPLTQDSPTTLKWNNGEGQLFSIELAIDEHYMISAKQTVANTGAGSIVARPFAIINRTSATASSDSFNVHSGPIGNFGDGVSFGPDYDDLAEDGSDIPTGNVEWLGFTDIYWLSALIPQDGANAEADFRSQGNEIFRADVIYQPVTVPAGRQISRTTQLFAGAKESAILDRYEAAGVAGFGNAIDWGWFGWIAKPIWLLLTNLFDVVKNFGLAIILMTVLIRLLLFPIAQKQFASMAQMKAVQPKMKAIQERFKDDKQKQQQEIMKLYKEEKVNPLAGCLPLLIQIPIFFALYKVLILAIEMRHQPFVLWIEDLSAPDPAKILNLFGLLPFDPPSFLGIGVLAVLLGVTMWATFRLNPTSMDPVQAQIFSIMPWALMFVMAPFAAGLLLYWVTNNLLTLAQQTYLYSKHPQLKAAAEKEKAEKAAAAERDAKKGKA
ncbi:membrane protein insertase YidC [Erythrobacter sp. HKB08]|uniref:membrane protein insertase YidC n=1 Tax=Erythrobacter sp. HKB08 TaxID=2502843 RepID=UPI001008B241|nr:membrane protein insertase YidC [Erythrobacter sp. HKB08]